MGPTLAAGENDGALLDGSTDGREPTLAARVLQANIRIKAFLSLLASAPWPGHMCTVAEELSHCMAIPRTGSRHATYRASRVAIHQGPPSIQSHLFAAETAINK